MSSHPLFGAARQPLVHFLVIGALLVAADVAFVPRKDDPRLILIDDAKYAELAGIFEDNQGRAPMPDELDTLARKWAQNEVLYREARILGLDKGDDMIRSRMVLKLRDVVFNRVNARKPDAERLKAWFEENRVLFDEPARITFEQLAVGDLADGPAAAEALAATLATEPLDEVQADALRVYEDRPEPNLVAAFGDDALKLVEAPLNEWQVVSSKTSWHVARVTMRTPGEPADFEDVRTRAGELYRSQLVDNEVSEMMRAIADKYEIRVELSAPVAQTADTASADGEPVASRGN